MTWYTLKWEDSQEGCIVEHFPTRAIAERRDKEVQETSHYSQTYSINEHTIKNRRELLIWLNANYDRENG